MLSKRALLLASSTGTALLATASVAHAGGFAIREQSATAQGASFAGAASGSGGLSSMFWNPATITMAPGWQSEWHGSVIFPYANIEPDAATQAQISGLGARAGYSSYQVNDRLWVGLSTGAPFGLGTKSNVDWAGQVYGRSSRVFTFNATPTIGYKVTDWLSIGAGAQLQYISVNLSRAAPANIALSPFQRAALTAGGATAAQLAAINAGIAGLTAVSPLAPSARLKGDDIGIGYTLGATVTPWAGTEIGLGFRSSIHHELEGTIVPAFATSAPISARVNLPEIATVGLTQRIGPQWKVMLGYEWSNWSRVKNIGVVNDLSGTIATQLPFHYHDGHFVSAGAEYQWSPTLALRAGVAYEKSPITDEVRTVNLPDNNRIWASIGASYRISEKLSVDVAYSHIFVKKTVFRIDANNPNFVAPLFFSGEARPSVDIVSAAVKYRWDDPVVAIPAPIVRKY
jgi:long-chain fatty acid transport protein